MAQNKDQESGFNGFYRSFCIQCGRICTGLFVIILGILSIVGGTLALEIDKAFQSNDTTVDNSTVTVFEKIFSDETVDEVQFGLAVSGGLWSILAGCLGCCCLPCCFCCCRKADTACRKCILALDSFIALVLVALAVALIYSDVRRFDEIRNTVPVNKRQFNISVALFCIGGFEFILGVICITIIFVILMIKRRCNGEVEDDDDAEAFQAVKSTSSNTFYGANPHGNPSPAETSTMENEYGQQNPALVVSPSRTPYVFNSHPPATTSTSDYVYGQQQQNPALAVPPSPHVFNGHPSATTSTNYGYGRQNPALAVPPNPNVYYNGQSVNMGNSYMYPGQ